MWDRVYPFELIFGKNVKGPLDLLKQSWLEEEADEKVLIDWVDQVRSKMISMAEMVCERNHKAKQEMKQLYDKSAREKSLEEGEMVMARKPGLSGKLKDVWEGPYVIGEKLSAVKTYLGNLR